MHQLKMKYERKKLLGKSTVAKQIWHLTSLHGWVYFKSINLFLLKYCCVILGTQ